MAMASACGVVAATPSKVTLSQWDASSSLLSSESFRGRAACANSASSSSASVPPVWESLTISGRGLRKHGSVLGQRRRRRNRVQVAAEGGEGEEPREAVSERWSLDELDEQLKVFESREVSAPRQIPSPRQIRGDSNNQQNAANGDLLKLQWPAFSTGFFVYAGIGLFLLTIFNNVLYKIFLGPPGVDRKESRKTTVPATPRYRVTTLQEEREAREARDAQGEALAAQSREAPRPLE